MEIFISLKKIDFLKAQNEDYDGGGDDWCLEIAHADSRISIKVIPQRDEDQQITGWALQYTTEPISRSDLVSPPVLLTGEAASGKTTFTKQYVHRLAAEFLGHPHEAPSTSPSTCTR